MSSGDEINKMVEFQEGVAKLKDSFKADEFDWEKYIKKPVPRLELKWLIIPIISYCILLLLALLIDFQSETISNLLFITVFGNCGWVVFSVHQRFENITSTGIALLFCLLLLLVAFGFLTPIEATEQARDLIPSS